MFHTPLREVTFEQVENFCKTFAEGVRVEYKREPTKNIPKIISSLANSSGGIWIIGVDTDRATNLPKFPLEGMDRKAGVEEQIVQSAQTGIYPALTPDVRVLDVPGKPNRMLVVVKVPESIDAPHAIENSTKVYIRNASTTEPYELADIDRIAYFLKRREEPEKRREQLIAQAVSRSWVGNQRMTRVIVTPIYPRGNLLPHNVLWERAKWLQSSGGSRYLRDYRLIHEGLSSVGTAPGKEQYYFEVNTAGIVFVDEPGEVDGLAEDVLSKDKTPFVSLARLIWPVANGVNTAIPFLKNQVTNVLVRFELNFWQGVGYLEAGPHGRVNAGGEAKEHRLTESHIGVSVPAVLEMLPESRVEVVTEIMRQVLWAFNVTNQNLSALVDATLKANRLV